MGRREHDSRIFWKGMERNPFDFIWFFFLTFLWSWRRNIKYWMNKKSRFQTFFLCFFLNNFPSFFIFFCSILKLLNLINYFNFKCHFYSQNKTQKWKIIFIRRRNRWNNGKKIFKFKQHYAIHQLTLRSFWKLQIVDLCKVERGQFAVVQRWICAFPLLKKREYAIKIIEYNIENYKKNIYKPRFSAMQNNLSLFSPFTCCTDVSLRSQRSSNGVVAAGSKSAVYCLIPPDVL